MYYHIEITQQLTKDGLNKRIWRFYVTGPYLRLDSVMDWRKTTPQPKFNCIKSWHRVAKRRDNMERIEPPEEIKQLAIDKFRADITFT